MYGAGCWVHGVGCTAVHPLSAATARNLTVHIPYALYLTVHIPRCIHPTPCTQHPVPLQRPHYTVVGWPVSHRSSATRARRAPNEKSHLDNYFKWIRFSGSSGLNKHQNWIGCPQHRISQKKQRPINPVLLTPGLRHR